jgi:hypothetical protein
MANQILKTNNGVFTKDSSNLSHYISNFGENILSAAEDAMSCLPKPADASFFWFNGTFCPILSTDTHIELADRWQEWRKAYQENPGSLLSKIEEFSKK